MTETSREIVVALLKAEPHLNQTEIALRVGISRERVRQIVASEGIPVRRGRRGARGVRLPVATVITGGVAAAITHSVAGTISELLVAADLMARGYVVFAPIARSRASCDLISILRGKCERIEVRSARRIGGVVKWNVPDKSRFDRLALVITGEPVQYRPSFEE